MSSVIRSVIGAAFILTGASAAMAASDTPAVQEQAVQTSASADAAAPADAAASNDAPAAEQAVQASSSATVVAAVSTPVVAQSSKPHSTLCDNSDEHGGHGPNTHWGVRAFWDQASSSD